MARTLTQKQITSIQQAIAARTGQFDFDISFDEVWAEVERVQQEEVKRRFNAKKYKGMYIGWQTAASMAQDDWGVYNITIAYKSHNRGNTHLTFPNI